MLLHKLIVLIKATCRSHSGKMAWGVGAAASAQEGVRVEAVAQEGVRVEVCRREEGEEEEEEEKAVAAAAAQEEEEEAEHMTDSETV